MSNIKKKEAQIVKLLDGLRTCEIINMLDRIQTTIKGGSVFKNQEFNSAKKRL